MRSLVFVFGLPFVGVGGWGCWGRCCWLICRRRVGRGGGGRNVLRRGGRGRGGVVVRGMEMGVVCASVFGEGASGSGSGDARRGFWFWL